MADVSVEILTSAVSYKAWLTTSYIASAIVGDDGLPLIKNNEFGTDQADALESFMEEATRELLKIFLSRQGDATGTPFEYDGTTAIYRFNEATPLLAQADAIKNSLYEDAKNALFVYVTILWFRMKDNEKQSANMLAKYSKLTANIEHHLYKLHD